LSTFNQNQQLLEKKALRMLSKDEIVMILQDLRRTFEAIEDECRINERNLSNMEIEFRVKEDSSIRLFAIYLKYQAAKLENWLGILKVSLNKLLKKEVENG